jgi:NadR type nicotinamide-nucleotide adenylyltransferase
VSDRTAHGLIIGKCYPPHAGHELLVRTAAAVSERVSVLVLAHPDEALPLADRVSWLAAAVADLPHVTVAGGDDPHPIDYADPAVWDLHEREFRAVLTTITDEPVTAVFSSEPYGAELARRFDATAVSVDPQRSLVPICATDIRADPVAGWEWLPAPVRAGLARRVVVVGAESTGKTTLCRDLTDALRLRLGAHGATRWVPEVGRERTVELQAAAVARAALAGAPPPPMEALEWPTAEFVAIATAQNRREDVNAASGGPVLVCDTDAFATGIWHERYVGRRDASVDALARHHDLYLLAHDEGVPFVQDGIRDGEHLRSWMTKRFADELVGTHRRHVVLTGSWTERRDAALAAIDALLIDGWPFTAGPA